MLSSKHFGTDESAIEESGNAYCWRKTTLLHTGKEVVKKTQIINFLGFVEK